LEEEGKEMTYKWFTPISLSEKEYYIDDTEKIIGQIERTYEDTYYAKACEYSPWEQLGEYMTKEAAKKAVEVHIIKREELKQRFGKQ